MQRVLGADRANLLEENETEADSQKCTDLEGGKEKSLQLRLCYSVDQVGCWWFCRSIVEAFIIKCWNFGI